MWKEDPRAVLKMQRAWALSNIKLKKLKIKKNPGVSRVWPDTQTGDMDLHNLGSRLPRNAEKEMQGKGQGNWPNAENEKLKRNSNFHKASLGST